MPDFKDLTEKTFGKLNVIKCEGKRGQTGFWWLTECTCGNRKVIRGQSLVSGRTTSCGCSAKDWCTVHGMEASATYNAWAGMKQRCSNPKYKSYPSYGGRGIRVCPEWDGFVKFYEDMGEKPKGLSLDRIDNNKGYSKENCRWATSKEQTRNRNVTFKYEGISVAELSEKHGIPIKRLRERIKAGIVGDELFSKSKLNRFRNLLKQG